jgi:hypothetical protein
MQAIASFISNATEEQFKSFEITKEFLDFITELDMKDIDKNNKKIIEWVNKLSIIQVHYNILGLAYEKECLLCDLDMHLSIYNKLSDMVKTVWKADSAKKPVEFGCVDRKMNHELMDTLADPIKEFGDEIYDNLKNNVSQKTYAFMNERCSNHLLGELKACKECINDYKKRIAHKAEQIDKSTTFERIYVEMTDTD